MIYDFLIIGQGLAGTLLSYELNKAGKRVFVIDHPKENSATKLAAGVFNPVVYRRLVKSFMAEKFIPAVFETYRDMESLTGENIFFPMPFHKLFASIEELNNWQVNSGLPENRPFMSFDIFKDDYEGSIANPYGAGTVLKAGIVDLPFMLSKWKSILAEENRFAEGVCNEENLSYDEAGWNLTLPEHRIKAREVVFCEGAGMTGNHLFNWLPLQHFKGEVIEIEAPGLKVNTLINRGVFVLPDRNKKGVFKVGATHNWRDRSDVPTEAGKKELTGKLDKIISVPYKVTRHRAGFRPATRDRRPFLGTHPDISSAHVFNGLGSKGVLMAPFLAKQMAGYLTGQTTIMKEFDIKRYYKFYRNDQKN